MTDAETGPLLAAVRADGPLGPAERHFAATGAAAALGRVDLLAPLFDAYLAAGLAPEALYETVLQLYLFVGYPRAINALAALDAARDRAGLPPWPARPSAPPDAWRADGEALAGAIYGGALPALRERMTRLSPELAGWFLDEGYGKVLSRPGLAPAAREASVVGALLVQGVEPQLHSHLRGSLRVGIAPEALAQTIQIASILAPERRLGALALLSKLSAS